MFGLVNSGIRELLAIQNGAQRTKRVRVSRRFKQRIFWRDGGCCVFCDQPVAFEKATLDHVIPLTRGGKNRAKENFAIACKSCNVQKGPYVMDDPGDLAPDMLWMKFDKAVRDASLKQGNYPDWIAAH